eukprot:CAMPEP_0176379484 /NCGR_PEP_ID=MMETSP0126-20121128/30387_1 /TAXON_ID=141414 ORGANISM="Strombidinopsis acuminatum, Strain SPMC142" /NCGR_SAMPLE_ID=MMETSP0126 /ASSEMBLY_ACC=CAM_ASM_000229 /LENGTH=62 /DNA_ID=CAMNT_0017742273 /DNA_START=1144 /DNA_END=1332 /DNA_ORIENTATION=+
MPQLEEIVEPEIEEDSDEDDENYVVEGYDPSEIHRNSDDEEEAKSEMTFDEMQLDLLLGEMG